MSVYLITGGTGSFGRTVTEYLLSKNCEEIRIFSRDEAKQDEMRSSVDDSRVKFYIGDVRDHRSIYSALQGVDYVFHAAALKQVPSCEFFPMQAVHTNIIGSDNLIRAAIARNVKRVVCLSTDKAVYPINAMGISKSMMEKIALSYARQEVTGDTIISAVRYGNVMYSRGSVIPKFVDQIRNQRDVTLTEPTMTRFLMALSESVELVNHAFKNARQGDIFIKKAPAASIGDLATAMLELFESNSEIKIIGIRHGEKMFETLASKEELVTAEDMGQFFRVQMDTRDLNYEKYFSDGNADEVNFEDYHSHNTVQLDTQQIKDLLLTLPEIRVALGQAN